MVVLGLLTAPRAVAVALALSVEMAQRPHLHLEMAAMELRRLSLVRLSLMPEAVVAVETAALVALLVLAVRVAVEQAALVLQSTEHLELLTPAVVVEQRAEHSRTIQLLALAAPVS